MHHDVAVPLFLVHRRDIVADGRAPTLLWGGGFDIPVTPVYRPGWRAWVDADGVVAVACLRGGGEYGRTWHDDGRRANKQHVFDDALACAAWLTGRHRPRVTATALTAGTDPAAVWTTPERLGIRGALQRRAPGGRVHHAGVRLLRQRRPGGRGARPDPLPPLHDRVGWASDYGSPDDRDDLEVLLRYSPYHKVRPGTRFPPTMLTTGDTDDRVVPAHSYKFAAALQHAQAGPAPVLLRVDVAAGHGLGKPTRMLLDERADVLAFHAHHLGLAGSRSGSVPGP